MNTAAPDPSADPVRFALETIAAYKSEAPHNSAQNRRLMDYARLARNALSAPAAAVGGAYTPVSPDELAAHMAHVEQTVIPAISEQAARKIQGANELLRGTPAAQSSAKDGVRDGASGEMDFHSATELARKAIYGDNGRGMIGANRNHLEQRVARAILRARASVEATTASGLVDGKQGRAEFVRGYIQSGTLHCHGSTPISSIEAAAHKAADKLGYAPEAAIGREVGK